MHEEPLPARQQHRQVPKGLIFRAPLEEREIQLTPYCRSWTEAQGGKKDSVVEHEGLGWFKPAALSALLRVIPVW